MPFPRILPAAEADILAVRATTLSDYGSAKLAEYDELLEEALEALAENPRAGRHCPEIAPSAWMCFCTAYSTTAAWKSVAYCMGR